MDHRNDSWTIGILFSRSGAMQIPATQHALGALLAIDEINAEGGVLDRSLMPIQYDTRSDLGLYRQFADRLLAEDGVDNIIGCCTSLSRKVVLSSIERRNALLWYPDLYEGFEYSPNVLYIGAATNQNSLPLARYLFRQGARRFLLIGTDYIYPREANRVMRDLIARHGGEVLEEIYTPMEPANAELDRVVARILSLQPDVVFSTLVGESICRFCSRYADAGIDPSRVALASHNITEAELAAVDRAQLAGVVTAAPYFSSIDSPQNRAFVARFRRRFGAEAPISQYAASSYSAVRLFAAALSDAGEMNTQRIAQCALSLELDAPHGRIALDADNNHTWQTPRVGAWNGRDAFDIVWEADQPVQPDPWLVSYGGVEEVPEIGQPGAY